MQPALATVPAFYRALLPGLGLLAFSTSPDEGGVVTLGLPFLALAALFALPKILEIIPRLDWRISLLPALYIMFIAIGTVFAENPVQSFVRALVNLIAYLIYMGVIAHAHSRRGATQYSRLLLGSGFVLACYFIINFLLAVAEHGLPAVVVERYVGGLMSLPWGASNTIAQVLLLSIVAYSSIESKRPEDHIMLWIISVGIVFTFSRSNTAFLVLLLILGMRWNGRLQFVAFFGILAAVLVAASASSAIDLDIADLDVFLESRLDVEKIVSGSGRWESAIQKFDYFISHPLEPVGYYSSLAVFQVSAHNYWLTTLVEQSFLSVLVSISFFSYIAYMAFRISLRTFYSFLVVVLALCVEDPQFAQPYIISFWTLAAVLISLSSQTGGAGARYCYR